MTMDLTLHVWRQDAPGRGGRFETYRAKDISEHMSFLEMLDLVNEGLVQEGKEPIAFDHDCREGICGSCGMVINGKAHGPWDLTTVCQLHMRGYHDGQELWIEPWRARAFPVVRDLIVDRTSFDRIIQAGGYISVRTGSAPEANATPVPKQSADAAFDAAACIGCVLVWPLVRTRPPCSSLPPRSRTSVSFLRDSRSAGSERWTWLRRTTRKVSEAVPIMARVR